MVSVQGLSVAETWLRSFQSINNPIGGRGRKTIKMVTSVINTQIHETEKALRVLATSEGLKVRPFQTVKFRSFISGKILGRDPGGKPLLSQSQIPRRIKKIPARPTDPIKNCENSSPSK